MVNRQLPVSIVVLEMVWLRLGLFWKWWDFGRVCFGRLWECMIVLWISCSQFQKQFALLSIHIPPSIGERQVGDLKRNSRVPGCVHRQKRPFAIRRLPVCWWWMVIGDIMYIWDVIRNLSTSGASRESLILKGLHVIMEFFLASPPTDSQVESRVITNWSMIDTTTCLYHLLIP